MCMCVGVECYAGLFKLRINLSGDREYEGAREYGKLELVFFFQFSGGLKARDLWRIRE